MWEKQTDISQRESFILPFWNIRLRRKRVAAARFPCCFAVLNNLALDARVLGACWGIICTSSWNPSNTLHWMTGGRHRSAKCRDLGATPDGNEFKHWHLEIKEYLFSLSVRANWKFDEDQDTLLKQSVQPVRWLHLVSISKTLQKLHHNYSLIHSFHHNYSLINYWDYFMKMSWIKGGIGNRWHFKSYILKSETKWLHRRFLYTVTLGYG